MKLILSSQKALLQKLSALLLAAVLCCVPLVGCANNSDSTDTKADTPAASQSTDAAKDDSTTAPSEAEAEKAEEAAVTANDDATEITVTVEVTGDFEDTSVASSGDYTVAADASALDALQATDLDVVVEDSQYGAYVTSVDGLAAEGSNGWLYSVNGESPSVSAGDYKLADGDKVVWSYYVAE